MSSELKSSLTDAARALPLVGCAVVLMAAAYIIAFRLIWGNWPF